jgi:hypothetical protein
LERLAHPALNLPAFIRERPVSIVGPLCGIAVAGVGVADQEEEHENSSEK